MNSIQGNKRNLIIVGAIIIAIGVAGYYYATRDTSSSATLIVSDSSGTSTVEGDLLATLQQLKQIRLDTSIFSSPVWSSLNDFSKQISPIPAGRPDPFAPLDSASLSAAGSATTSTTGR